MYFLEKLFFSFQFQNATIRIIIIDSFTPDANICMW